MCEIKCERSIRIISVGIKYSIHALICAIISYCASSFDRGNNRICDKPKFKNLKMREKMEIKETVKEGSSRIIAC